MNKENICYDDNYEYKTLIIIHWDLHILAVTSKYCPLGQSSHARLS